MDHTSKRQTLEALRQEIFPFNNRSGQSTEVVGFSKVAHPLTHPVLSAELSQQYKRFLQRTHLGYSQEEVFLRKAISLISEQISNPKLDVPFLARRLFLSPSQLNRRMNALINCPAGQLIRMIRLEYAAKLLLKKAASVSDIAAEVGYQTQASFCRSFKQRFGCAPSGFCKSDHRHTPWQIVAHAGL